MPNILDQFSEPTRHWFTQTFAGGPTLVQQETWRAVSDNHHALVVAPTGSGKTLAAFLWAIDQLVKEPTPTEPQQRCRILYISPLKALAADVERNLSLPLAGISDLLEAQGRPRPNVVVHTRTGDTPAAQRRRFLTHPPDILITTPESLYLLLTSQARDRLRSVRTVVVDEIHAVAGTKRGSHLALSLTRLELLTGNLQRIGLSATVRPVQAVAQFLVGSPQPDAAPTQIVQPPANKSVQLQVVVPVPDMTDLASNPEPSIWPHIHEQVTDLIAAHTSTLVFANSRRAAERLTSRVNEVWAQRHGAELAAPGALVPAANPAQSGTSVGVPVSDPTTIAARAHHGSMSRSERSRTEEELKAGLLPAVVATSSLELGIDMGAIDLVVQIGAPPSVASGLQRVGRAGHQVGAPSSGVLMPTFRGELVATAVIAERMLAGKLEPLHVPQQPLDVLAQQVVAMVAVDDWDLHTLYDVVRRAAPYQGLGEASFQAVVQMLAGHYPSEDFAGLRPRLLWDRVTNRLTALPGARQTAVISGGTIPDRGLFGVYLSQDAGKGSRRVGELDEEMVNESRVGDLFTLGSSTWRIDQITPDQVLVSPAPGAPGRLPFWKGDSLGRPASLGQAIGEWVRLALSATDLRPQLSKLGLSDWTQDNLLAYLREQQAATVQVPTDRMIVVERFRDELGDWRVVIHTPYGARVHWPWSLILAASFRARTGVDVAVMAADDGIVLRLPDGHDDSSFRDLFVDPNDVAQLVQDAVTSSAAFAARFREAASRALLLPRHYPGRRQPLWQQRHRAAQLLAVAEQFPDFPIVLEAVRECLQDDFDTPALVELMARVQSREISVHEVTTPRPSPFAQSLLLGYSAQFLYDGDSPLAERRAAALALDPGLLAELLGEGAQVADLLDPEAVAAVEQQLQGLPVRHLEDLVQLVRERGPLSQQELSKQVVTESAELLDGWLLTGQKTGRLVPVAIPGRGAHWVAVEDAARVRDGLGVQLPPGIDPHWLVPVVDPLGDLIRRFARHRGPFTVNELTQRFGGGPAMFTPTLAQLEHTSKLAAGALRPGGTGNDFCDPEVLRRLRRASLAAFSAQIAPVPDQTWGLFLPQWQQVGAPEVDLLRVVEQLAGAVFPASALESQILPARIPGYEPRLLDDLLGRGEIVWAGHGALGAQDGWVSLHLAESVDLTCRLPVPDAPTVQPQPGLSTKVVEVLNGGGAWLTTALTASVSAMLDRQPTAQEVTEALWQLVWSTQVTCDSWEPVRAWLAARTAPHRTPPPPVRSRARIALRPRQAVIDQRGAGRWSALPAPGTHTERVFAQAVQLLDRNGVVTSAVAAAEGLTGEQYQQVYQVLRTMEETGQVRRGYFVEHLGGTQFALPGAVERIRQLSTPAPGSQSSSLTDGTASPQVLLLAATDPAQPFGSTLPWPAALELPAQVWVSQLQPATSDQVVCAQDAPRPARRSGALVVVVDGQLAIYIERGARSLVSFTTDTQVVQLAVQKLIQDASQPVTLTRVNGAPVPGAGTDSPLARVLTAAGFRLTPSGLRFTP